MFLVWHAIPWTGCGQLRSHLYLWCRPKCYKNLLYSYVSAAGADNKVSQIRSKLSWKLRPCLQCLQNGENGPIMVCKLKVRAKLESRLSKMPLKSLFSYLSYQKYRLNQFCSTKTANNTLLKYWHLQLSPFIKNIHFFFNLDKYHQIFTNDTNFD